MGFLACGAAAREGSTPCLHTADRLCRSWRVFVSFRSNFPPHRTPPPCFFFRSRTYWCVVAEYFKPRTGGNLTTTLLCVTALIFVFLICRTRNTLRETFRTFLARSSPGKCTLSGEPSAAASPTQSGPTVRYLVASRILASVYLFCILSCWASSQVVTESVGHRLQLFFSWFPPIIFPLQLCGLEVLLNLPLFLCVLSSLFWNGDGLLIER